MHMHIEIELYGNEKINKLMSELPNEGKAASGKAIKEAMNTARRAAIPEITSVYTVKRRNINRTISSLYSAADGTGRLIFKGPRLSMMEFILRPNSLAARPENGLYLQVRRDGGGRLPHHFIAPIGGTNAFIRKGKSRFPLSKGHGPSVPAMVKNPEVTGNIRERAMKTYEEIFFEEFDRRAGAKK